MSCPLGSLSPPSCLKHVLKCCCLCLSYHQVLDRCLALETEVAQIPQLKRDVDRYRRTHTDMEVANREQVRAPLSLHKKKSDMIALELRGISYHTTFGFYDQTRIVRKSCLHDVPAACLERLLRALFPAGRDRVVAMSRNSSACCTLAQVDGRAAKDDMFPTRTRWQPPA